MHNFQNHTKTFVYSRTYIRADGLTITWHNQRGKCHISELPVEIVNDWNRVGVLQKEQHPENGLWMYVLES